jgi:hypothetical protein
MKKMALLCLSLLVFTTLGTAAQETAKPKEDERSPAVTPLRVQVVFTEYDGEKKVANLPYSFTVNADERHARPNAKLRSGARIPIATAKDQFTYVDVGTNVDCAASLQDNGSYKLLMSIERSSISPETPAGSSNPVVRQFRVDLNPVLKDGQSVESVVSTDPLNGHVYHVTVTLNVLKER